MASARNSLVFAAALALPLSAAARVSVSEIPLVLAATRPETKEGGAVKLEGRSGFDTDEGGFYFGSEDGRFRLVLGGRLQPRLEAGFGDEDEGVEDTLNFAMRRARAYAFGHIHSERIGFLLQVAADRGEDFELLDAWAKYTHSDRIAFKAGQFKLPFNRQVITSSGRLQFSERSLAAEEFRLDRDLGVELSGGFDLNRFQWAGAVVNGEGRNATADDTDLLFTGRIAFNALGNYGYSEGDLDHSEEMAASFGLAAAYQREQTELGEADFLYLNLDGGLKHMGLSLQGEYYFRDMDFDPVVEAGDLPDPDLIAQALVADGRLRDHGIYVQGGYFVVPMKAELVGRYSRVFFEGDENDRSELTLGVNYYWLGHRLKLQGDYSRLDEELTDVQSHRVVAQGQLWF